MIAKMRKLQLAALSYDKDEILNALERTHAVEVKARERADDGAEGADVQELKEYLAKLESALETLTGYAERRAKEEKDGKNAVIKDGFEVGYSEFMAAGSYRERADRLLAEISSLQERMNSSSAEQTKLSRAISAAMPYAAAEKPFSAYRDTKNFAVRFGIVSAAAYENSREKFAALSLAAFEEINTEEGILLTAVCHRSAIGEMEDLLAACGFTACPYTEDRTGAELVAELQGELKAAEEDEKSAYDALCECAEEVKNLKIYCDFVGFELEKAEATEKMLSTAHTFLFEAFVPADEEENVKRALGEKDLPLFYEFSDPKEGEFVPTLAKNNKVVQNFEAITNMYSAPNAREFDPNTVMSFFYSVFLGFIMGDIGYGILMMLGGGFLYYKNRAKEGGIKSLAGVFAIGGIFALIWGFLFNSLFGIQILPFTVMPDLGVQMPGAEQVEQNWCWTFIGIDIPAILIISMIIGIIQLFAGYLCKAWQCWRKGHIFDGICDGVTWAVFSLGALFAVCGFVEDFNVPDLKLIGGIMAAAGIVLAALTAGRHEKFIGKFTKGFGSLYGIINYASDVLSYARLYGLMLSGAVIAQIISFYSIGFITGGNFALAILGIILMVVGHIFNLAMGLLSAYIHDARLQYVEFYGKFFVGEGELFTPLGSQKKHVSVA